MNKIETSPRGFPFDERTLQELQDLSVPVLNAIARLIPDRSIIYGVENRIGPSGSVRSGGFILWDGEFLPFLEGPSHPQFSIVEEVLERTFNVGTDQDPQLEDHPAYIHRYAVSGIAPGAESTHNFSDLNRPPRFLNYLHQGLVYVGQIVPPLSSGSDRPGSVIDIAFPSVRTQNYMVLSSFYSAGMSAQGSFSFDVFDRRSDGFKIRIKNVTEPVSRLFYSYLIVPEGTLFQGLP